MSSFINRDNALATQLEEKLAKTFFREPSIFIDAYNSGQINRNNDDVIEIARSIVAAYKDVRESNKRLVRVSRHEVILEDTLEKLAPMVFLVRLRDIIEEGFKSGTISSEDDDIRILAKSGQVVNVDAEGKASLVSEARIVESRSGTDGKFVTDRELGYASDDNESFIIDVPAIRALDFGFLDSVYEAMPR